MKRKDMKSSSRKFLCNGYSDGFVPVEPLDLRKIKTVDDLVVAMKKTAFTGRLVGESADVLETMTRDKDCFVIMTLAGAMTVAKMNLVMCEMIERGMVHAIISTGALITHGFVETSGMTHFKYEWGKMKDEELFEKGYNRVYDTIELEKNLDDAEEIVFKVLDKIDKKQTLCSRTICRELGKYLSENTKGRGVLKAAYEHNVPIYIPAFTDSELGLDIGLYNRRMKIEGKPEFNFNPYLDLEHFTELVLKQKKTGLFTIGGGVPRNWAQQVSCYLDIIDKRIGVGGAFKRHHYGVRICPEPAHWGGLSGCTYSENVAWGKFVPENEGGRFSEVLDDATVVWPLIMKAVIERLEKKPAPKKVFLSKSDLI